MVINIDNAVNTYLGIDSDGFLRDGWKTPDGLVSVLGLCET